MMNRFLQPATAPLLFAGLAIPSVQADERPVVLELENGEVIRYHRTTTESQTMTQMGRTLELGRRVESDLTLTVLGRSAQGNFSIDLTVERMTGEIRRPMRPPVVFDTASGESRAGDNLATGMLTALAGKTIRLTVTPRGQVVSARGYVEALTAAINSANDRPAAKLAQLRAGVTDEAALTQMQMLFPRLPSEPPEQSASWTDSPGSGAGIEMLTTIESLDEQTYTATSSGSYQRDLTIGLQEPGLIKSSLKHSAQVSRANGLFVRFSLGERSVKNTKTERGVIPVAGTRTRLLELIEPPAPPAEDG